MSGNGDIVTFLTKIEKSDINPKTGTSTKPRLTENLEYLLDKLALMQEYLSSLYFLDWTRLIS